MWTGPIAASVLVKSAFEEEKVAKFLRINNGDGRLSINTWMRPKKLRVHYPVNVMRNLATEQAKTEVIFPIGVDFLPSRGLHAFLKRLVSEGLFVGRGAFAVPSFEVAKSTTVPRTKQEMLAAIERKLAKPSLSRGDPSSTDGVWEIAHVNFIDYPKWYATNHELYERPIEFHNEPYVVVNRSQPCFPDFDERFIYYGADKVEQIHHLSTLGWRFFVLPLHFVVHVQHASAAWHSTERSESEGKIAELIRLIKQERGNTECSCREDLFSLGALNRIVADATNYSSQQ